MSTDGGITFNAPPAPANLIIAPSTRYEPNKARVGTFMPKVVGDPAGSRVYVLVSQTNRNTIKRIGQCLLRSTDTQMNKWQLYDRGQWTEAPKSAYDTPTLSASLKDCTHVVAGNILSVKYIPKLKKFIAIGATNNSVYSQLSDDLVNWEDRVLIENFKKDNYDIKYKEKYQFPHGRWYFSLMDINRKSRNYDTIDNDPYLYFVEFENKKFKNNKERKLMRVKIKLDNF